MDIYENFVIGSFLYGLGAAMAHRNLGREVPGTLIGLAQQGPLDKLYGDLILQNPAIFRVFEFKRESNREKKEAAKLRILKMGMSTFSPEEQQRLKGISREIHWYVEIPKDKMLADQVRVVPYLDFETSSERIALRSFVTQTAESASREPRSQEQMREQDWYMTTLCACRGSDSAALIVLISPEGVNFEVLTDIHDWVRPSRRVIARRLAYEHRMEQQWKEKLTEAHEHLREYHKYMQAEHETYEQRMKYSHRIEPQISLF